MDVKAYLQNELKMPPVLVERAFAKLNNHQDILDEFASWIETKSYKENDAICVEGYTAKDIVELAPFLDGLGAFNFLITLRESPDKAKDTIAKGFPRK